jgi:hypothetical protein
MKESFRVFHPDDGDIFRQYQVFRLRDEKLRSLGSRQAQGFLFEVHRQGLEGFDKKPRHRCGSFCFGVEGGFERIRPACFIPGSYFQVGFQILYMVVGSQVVVQQHRVGNPIDRSFVGNRHFFYDPVLHEQLQAILVADLGGFQGLSPRHPQQRPGKR